MAAKVRTSRVAGGKARSVELFTFHALRVD
ncbi:unnamed protein product [Tuber melanosporum]|uniref:(Perigord truffle) hypothetical protein n=1 Tax=Tuber melanosporum (strain Mel28) TaxID=656061 RepID=D5GEQ2_TUBMM|nr:uncharacterized protein GSTUM_00001326001 [Tuber melanosporum]CAZ82995.1 unnamed protein product [Tuber melanosporum]